MSNTGSLDTKHPLFAEVEPDWTRLRAAHKGPRFVKDQGIEFLRPTSGMIEDGALTSMTSKGGHAYLAYKMRARFPDLVREATEALLGVMHNKPPQIELPTQLEYLREKATAQGESLEMLLQRVNECQLVTGRVGLLGDVIDHGKREGEFYVSLYEAEHVINWDEGDSDVGEPQALNLVVLDESAQARNGLEWEQVEAYRVLVLGDFDENEPTGDEPDQGAGTLTSEPGQVDAGDDDTPTPEAQVVYRAALFEETKSFTEESLEDITSRQRTTNEIPFVFVNARDVVTEPDRPPLLGLAEHAFAVYQGEADYRQSLFLQGQDTLVIIGAQLSDDEEDGSTRTGGGAKIELEVGGDAKFVGVDSSGLPEQRIAIENDYRRGDQMAGQLIDTTSRERESGDALQIRVAARTATLNRIALAGAFGVQELLRKLARWVGADETKVVVIPNLDFVDDPMTAQELVQAMTAKSVGAPWSLRSIHALMQKRGLTDKTFEEELALMVQEAEEIGPLDMGVGGSANPDGPVEEETEPDDEGDEEDDEGEEDDDDASAEG